MSPRPGLEKRYFSVTLSYGALAMPGHSPSGSSVQVSESPTLDFGFQRGVIDLNKANPNNALLGKRAWWMPKRLSANVPDLDIEGAKVDFGSAASSR